MGPLGTQPCASAAIPRKLASSGASMRQQGLFPLGRWVPTSESLQDLPRGSLRRFSRDLAETRWALNYLHGKGYRDRAIVEGSYRAKITHLQSLAQRRVEWYVHYCFGVDSALTPTVAYKNLPRGRSAYGAGDRPLNVARFEDGLVSLPTSVADAPRLKQVLPGPIADILDSFRTRMLRSHKHCEALDEVLGASNSFPDETL